MRSTSGSVRPRSMGSSARRRVGGAIHECLELLAVRHLHAHEPSVAEGILVDQVGPLLQRAVDRGHNTGDGREQIGHRLHGFDGAHRLHGGNTGAHFRQLHVDDVAQLAGGEVGDTDRRLVAVDANPFVLFGELQILEIHSCFLC
jgi:hypothetical protein